MAFHIVVDELQTLLNVEIVQIVPLFEKAASFVGVTGSPMPQNYQELLKMLLPTSLITNFPDTYK